MFKKEVALYQYGVAEHSNFFFIFFKFLISFLKIFVFYFQE
jgi:hypothetical protein